MNRRAWMDYRLLAGTLVVLGLACLGALSRPGPADDQAVTQAGTVWDSGWVDIATGTARVFTHNLAGDAALYAVDLWQRDTRPDGLGIHNRAYGGMNAAGQRLGVHWQNLTDSTITVVRWPDDVATGQVRLRVRQPDPPLYDSGWLSIEPGRVVTLTHNLGGDVDDYTVGVKFQDTTPDGRGIHQFAFGGLAAGRAFYGAAWRNLTDTTIRVVRFGNDTSVHQVRVFITRPDPPDYDSGWVDVAQDETRTITHNLGGNPDGYIVRSSARSTAADGPGINTRAAGGMEVGGQFLGSNWQNLTSTGLNVFRQPHDIFADQVRVRLWRPETPPAGPWQSWTNADYVRTLALDDGVLWAGTEGGAVRWNPTTGDYHKYLAPDGLEDGYVRAIAPDASGVTWFGTYDGGLVAYDGAAWTTFTTADGLASNYLSAIAARNGLKWVGTSGGLNAFDDAGTPYDSADDAWASFRTDDGLNTSSVYDLEFDEAGRLWMGSYPRWSGSEYVDGGLSVLEDAGTPFDKTDDTWMTYVPADSGDVLNGWGYEIVTDGPQQLWAATYPWWTGSEYEGGGLVLLDHAGTPFDKADDTWARFSTSDGLAGNGVWDIFFDAAGRLWLATSGGLSVLDHAGTPFEKSDDEWRTWAVADGLVDSYLYSVALDASGGVWVGAATGLSRMRGAAQRRLYLPLILR